MATGRVEKDRVNDLQFAEDVMARIRAREAGITSAAISSCWPLSSISSRGSGSAPCERSRAGLGLPRLCSEQYGLLAAGVLEHWGVTQTEDIGRIVFTLVEVGLLVTQPGDQESDFESVYDFAHAFGDILRVARASQRVRGEGHTGRGHGESRVARMPEVLTRKSDPIVRLRP